MTFEPESSDVLGSGFRCGFLGSLHMEVIKERLEREYSLELITTAPSVSYEILKTNGEEMEVNSPSELPTPNEISEIREPIIKTTILCPDKYVGDIIELAISKRGVQKNLQYLGGQVSIIFDLPLSEIVMDFFDRLKSVSRGFASLDYSFDRFQSANLTKLDILINGERVDALACIVHRDQAANRAKSLVKKMKEVIPRQLFDVAIQAAIGGQIIARQTVKALRKNVTA
mgnify:CR=1 FL=1